MVMAVADRDTDGRRAWCRRCVGTLRHGAGPDGVTEVAVIAGTGRGRRSRSCRRGAKSAAGSSFLCGMSVPIPVTCAPGRHVLGGQHRGGGRGRGDDDVGSGRFLARRRAAAASPWSASRSHRAAVLAGSRPCTRTASTGRSMASQVDLQLGLLAGAEDADGRGVRAGPSRRRPAHRRRRCARRSAGPRRRGPRAPGRSRALSTHDQAVVGRQPALGVAVGAGGDLDREVVGAR